MHCTYTVCIVCVQSGRFDVVYLYLHIYTVEPVAVGGSTLRQEIKKLLKVEICRDILANSCSAVEEFRFYPTKWWNHFIRPHTSQASASAGGFLITDRRSVYLAHDMYVHEM